MSIEPWWVLQEVFRLHTMRWKWKKWGLDHFCQFLCAPKTCRSERQPKAVCVLILPTGLQSPSTRRDTDLYSLCVSLCAILSRRQSHRLTFTKKTPPPPPPPPPPYHHHAGAQKVVKMLSSCTHMNIRMNGGQEHTDDQLIRKCVHVALHQVWVRVTARVELEKKLMASASSPAGTITSLQQHRIFCLLFSTISHAYKCTSFQWGQLRETWVIGWFTLS